MRAATILCLLGLLGPLAAGCGGSSSGGSAGPPAGCDLVPPAKVVGVLGGNAVLTTAHGTLTALRTKHVAARCRSVVPGHRERYVAIQAAYHPKPVQLPSKSCSEGWVYAGTPTKYTPACQETVDGHGRTELVVRWQPYVMHVTIGRTDRDWGGDPEIALAMSRTLAQRLGVKEAAGNG